MLPIILESTNDKERKNFIDDFIDEQNIKPFNCFNYEPENKEISIKQIREIINETVFHSTEPRLFHILRFDSASAEAQNAFLKTLEEHQPNLFFILSVDRSSALLPTIRSRSRLVKLSVHKSEALSSELETLVISLASGQLPTMFQITNRIGKTDTSSFFDSLIALYRTRLITDKKAGPILKEAIRQRNLLRQNHIDPQTCIDSTLIFIYKTYNQ